MASLGVPAPLFPLSIRTHLILISIALTMTPVITFGVIQSRSIRARAIADGASAHQETANAIAREIDFFISDAADNLKSLATQIARMPHLRADALEAAVRGTLDTRTINHIVVMTPGARSIVNLTRDERLPTGVDYSDRPYIRALLTHRSPQLSPPLVGKLTRRLEVFLGLPVVDRAGAVRAILVAGLDFNELHSRHLVGQTTEDNVTLLLNPSGRLMLASNLAVGDVFSPGRDHTVASEPWQRDSRLLIWADDRGQRLVGASAQLSTWRWTVLSGVSESRLLQAMAVPVHRLGYAVLWLLAACVIASPLVARAMAAPILALQRQARRLAEGALGAQVSVARYPPREVLELADAFNTMSAELARQYTEAEAFAEIGRQFSSSLDPQTVYQTIVTWARELCDGDLAVFASYDAECRAATVTAFAGARTELLPDYQITPGDPVADRVLASGEPFVTDDYLNDPRTSGDSVELARAEGFVAALAVPLSLRNRTIGLLWVVNRRPVPFTPRHQQVLQKLAAHAAVALENVRLFQESQHRVRETETLLAVGQAVSSTMDLQEVLRRGARELARTLGADSAGAYLISSDGHELRPFAGYRLPKGRLDYLRHTAIPLHWNRFVQEAFQLRRAIASQDCLRDPRFNEEAKLFDVRAVVMAPFLAGEEITGCLFAIWWEKPHLVTTHELELADGIGRQLALAVENSRLHQQTLDRAAALAESEDRYRRLAEGAKDIIYTKDARGRFTYLNPRVQEVLGYRPDELLGQPAIQLVVPSDHDRVKDSLVRALSGERPSDVFEIEVIRKDGSTVHLEVSASVISDADGKVVGRQEIARDLTERRRLEEEVRERKRLEEINRFKSQFLANMSHELRTPMNAVLGFSELLQDPRFGPLTDKQARFLNHVVVSGRHLLALIDDILDLAKIEAGKLRLHPAPFDVGTAIEEVCGIMQPHADLKHQVLTTDVAPGTGLCVADHQRLHQILLNLLSNAIKFTPDAGQITVSARRIAGTRPDGHRAAPAGDGPPIAGDDADRDTIEISVRDTGVGISPDDLPRLFKEFEQLEPFDRKTHEGTGLGLALCKHLVELHGGRIWASSDGTGRGSTFTFTIPAVVSPERAGDG
jgi:PAS domain S-box-containing protein